MQALCIRWVRGSCDDLKGKYISVFRIPVVAESPPWASVASECILLGFPVLGAAAWTSMISAWSLLFSLLNFRVDRGSDTYCKDTFYLSNKNMFLTATPFQGLTVQKLFQLKFSNALYLKQICTWICSLIWGCSSERHGWVAQVFRGRRWRKPPDFFTLFSSFR